MICKQTLQNACADFQLLKVCNFVDSRLHTRKKKIFAKDNPSHKALRLKIPQNVSLSKKKIQNIFNVDFWAKIHFLKVNIARFVRDVVK